MSTRPNTLVELWMAYKLKVAEYDGYKWYAITQSLKIVECWILKRSVLYLLCKNKFLDSLRK